MGTEVQSTLDAIRAAYVASSGKVIENADQTTAGLAVQGIDLRPVAQLSVQNTEYSDRFVKRIQGLPSPTVTGRIVQGLTGVASGRFGTAEEGKRGGTLSVSGSISGATHKTISIEQGVTDEAIFTAQNSFDPFVASADWALAEAKRTNHRFNLFGRTTTASDSYAPGALTSGAASTPAAIAATTGGFLPAATYLISIVPLTGEAAYRTRGYALNSGFAGGSPAAGSELLPYTRTNADASTTTEAGGCGQKSAEVSSIVGGSGAGKVTLSWTPTVGALGYAVFAGTVSGTLYFQGVVSSAYAVWTVYNSGASFQANTGVFTADTSTDALQYDGLFTRLLASGSGADVLNLTSGSSLTANSRGGIAEIDAMLAKAWQKFLGFSYKHMAMSGTTYQALLTVLFGSPSTSKVTFLQQAMADDPVGLSRRSYSNPFSKTNLEIVTDPYIPDGVILFGTDAIPNTVSGGVDSAPVSFVYLRDYYGDDWARVTRSRKSAVHLMGSVFLRAPSIFGVLGNIAV